MTPLPRYDPDDPYPESDGQPMAENTEQYEWLVKIKENLEVLFADDPNVFVAGDLFWYPVADRRITGPLAPDVMVVIGRPKGRRGCYKQWEEGGIAPQVVFEVRSPSNSQQEMAEKRAYYDTYGVEEYYVYDPPANTLEVWLRQDGRLGRVSHLKGWTSPRLGIRFALSGETLEIFDPQGQPFLTTVELPRDCAVSPSGPNRRPCRHNRSASGPSSRSSARNRRMRKRGRSTNAPNSRLRKCDRSMNGPSGWPHGCAPWGSTRLETVTTDRGATDTSK
jgi:Uma2 family endonuclease